MRSEPGGDCRKRDEGPSRAPPGASPDSNRPPGEAELQILSTEHRSLLATRSLSWGEASSRAQPFRTSLEDPSFRTA